MRNRGTIGLVTYDRRGNPYHALDGAYGLYETNSRSFMDGAHPYCPGVTFTCSINRRAT